MKKWKEEALKLASDSRTKSWRSISRRLGVPNSTVSDFLRSQKRLGELVKAGPRILILDIETSPIVAAVFGRWKQNIHDKQVLKESYMLCWAAKWLGDPDVAFDSLHLHSDFYYGDSGDLAISKSIWNMINAADIVVAHNGDNFDIKVLNTRFLLNGLTPPHPSKMVDTLKIAKRKFRFSSNSLNNISRVMGFGEKSDDGGMETWIGCISGQKESFEKMLEYNINDVLLLEKVYLGLRPWDHLHPNYNVYTDSENTKCSHCGSEEVELTGMSCKTQVGSYDTVVCRDCGGYSRTRIGRFSRSKAASITVPARW